RTRRAMLDRLQPVFRVHQNRGGVFGQNFGDGRLEGAQICCGRLAAIAARPGNRLLERAALMPANLPFDITTVLIETPLAISALTIHRRHCRYRGASGRSSRSDGKAIMCNCTVPFSSGPTHLLMSHTNTGVSTC